MLSVLPKRNNPDAAETQMHEDRAANKFSLYITDDTDDLCVRIRHMSDQLKFSYLYILTQAVKIFINYSYKKGCFYSRQPVENLPDR